MQPQHFGKYILLDKIGSGGMAEVFLAKQRGIKGFEKVLAIKRILPNLTENPEFVSMFINEAKLAALLSHQNIVHIFELGHVENVYYIAMEYLMGKDLRTVLQQARDAGQPLSIDHILLIFTKVCAGLDYAHRKKDLEGRDLRIVHRDISPQNILVSYEGEVKLVDFGIAKAASQASETRAGMIKGKLSYLSPEQAWGKPVDCRTDIFAMGIVLYEMLTGQKLFKGHDEFSTLEKVREGKIEPLPMKINPDISPVLEGILLKALAREPEDRYQTVADLQMALEDHMAHSRYDFSTVRLTQSLQKIFSTQMHTDSERFRAAQQAKAETPTEDRSTVVRPAPPRPVSRRQASSEQSPARPARRKRRGAFAKVRFAVLALVLMFVSAVWMARVDFPLIYSLRVRSPSAQVVIDDLVRLPEQVFDRWVAPYLSRNTPEPFMTAAVAASAMEPGTESPAVGPDSRRSVKPVARPPAARRPVSPQERAEIQRLFFLSEAAYNEGKLGVVEENLRRIIDLDPQIPKAYHLLGTILAEQNQNPRALKIFQEATRQFPRNPQLRYDLGFLYLDFDLASLARAELTKAIELKPEGPEAEKARAILGDGEVSGQSVPAPARTTSAEAFRERGGGAP